MKGCLEGVPITHLSVRLTLVAILSVALLAMIYITGRLDRSLTGHTHELQQLRIVMQEATPVEVTMPDYHTEWVDAQGRAHEVSTYCEEMETGACANAHAEKVAALEALYPPVQ